MMKHFYTMLMFALVATGGLRSPAQELLEEDPDQVMYLHRPAELPGADELLSGVRAALPRMPMRIHAQLKAKSPRGETESLFNTEMLLDWHGTVPTATYTIRDAFGENLERLVVEHHVESTSRLTYLTGSELQDPAEIRLTAYVQETDVSWIDLSLAYLWWKDGQTLGVEKVKGRVCYIVELPVPATYGGAVKTVRLWVDPKVHVLLQASTYDGEGLEIRRLQVKSLKKVNEIWVVKDIEVRNLEDRTRTLLRVQEVRPLDAEPAG